jgi:hypothetical protein
MPLPLPCQPHELQFELEQPEQFEPLPAPESPLLLWAKTDICFSRSSLPHSGHSGLLLPMTRVSNSLPQARQIKSYNGILFSPGSKKKLLWHSFSAVGAAAHRSRSWRKFRPSRSIVPLERNRQVLHLDSFIPKVDGCPVSPVPALGQDDSRRHSNFYNRTGKRKLQYGLAGGLLKG